MTRFRLAPDPDRPLIAIPATRDSPPRSRDSPFPRLSWPFPLRLLHPLRVDRSLLYCILPFHPHVIRTLDYLVSSPLIGRISLKTGSGLRPFCSFPHMTPSHFYFSRSPFDLIHSPFPDRVPTLAPSTTTYPVGYELGPLVTATRALFLHSLSVVLCSFFSVSSFAFRLYRFTEIPSSLDFITRFPPRYLVVLYKPM